MVFCYDIGMKGIIFTISLLMLMAAGCQLGTNKPSGYGCIDDVKMCSDGSYVGRTAPNCEFAACTSSEKPSGQVCTQEAMLCADGSAVGRTGPNCEFAKCPGAK